MSDIQFGKDDIQFFGLRRSGNHAVISWILAHYKGKATIHFNNAQFCGDSIQAHSGGLEATEGSGVPMILMNFEDLALDVISGSPLMTSKKILVLRDPFNTFASRLKRVRDMKGTVHEHANAITDYTLNLWKQYAREFLGETNFLDDDAIKINFNQWFRNENYRRELSQHFGEFTDEGLGTISKFTFGSSFDGYDYDDKALEMDLSNRWMAFQDDEEYRSLFDEEIIELSNRIFGSICAIQPHTGLVQKRVVENALRLAQILKAKEKYKEAEKILKQALRVEPDNKDILDKLALVQISIEPCKSWNTLTRQMDKRDKEPEYWNNLSTCLNAMKDFEQAANCAEFARCLDKGKNPEYVNNYAYQLYCNCQYDESISVFEKLVEEHDNPAYWLNLGNVYMARHRLGDALHAYKQCLRHDPENPGTMVNMAFAYFQLGNLSRFYECYERRIHHFDNMKAYTKMYGQPWAGNTSVKGKTVLLYCEQGLGDAIQFARYIPMFRSYYGCKIILNCNKGLIPLFQNWDCIDQCVAKEDVTMSNKPEFDEHLPLVSIPHRAQYYHINGDPYIYTTERMDQGEGFKIGVCWNGNPRHPNDYERSCAPGYFTPLQLPGVQLIPLQKDLNPDINDFGDTAKIIADLDLIITVDTSVLHLAGAMGKQTWGLIAHKHDWRWGLAKETTDWYSSVRLFRQEKPRDWQGVFERVEQELRNLINQG